MPHLSLSFLGGFDVALDAEAVTAIGADKASALLAFLAIEAGAPGARSHRRSKLCAMFWPDLPEKKAAHNLSQTLLRLRRTLAEPGDPTRPSFLVATTQDVQFNTSSDYDLDVARFRELLSLVERRRRLDATRCEECHRWLAQAAALYRGNLFIAIFALCSKQSLCP
jgi:DNA-binding SARP family transcriptional activator